MAAAKKTVKKKTRKPSRKPKKQKPVLLTEVKKIVGGIAILVSLCLTIAMTADIFFKPGTAQKHRTKTSEKQLKSKTSPVQIKQTDPLKKEPALKSTKVKKAAAGLKPKSDQVFTFEVFGEVDQSVLEKQLYKPRKGHLPKVVIIIDDIGYDRRIAMALAELDDNITFSILPFAPFGRTISKRLHAKGAQLMLHLPMEPFEYPEVNPGPGAILSSMSPDTLMAQLEKSINDIPHVVGVNNHMGSKITTNADQMNQIFTVLKKKNLFFIDSRTAPRSQCRAAARLFQLQFAQRDIFLDNFQNTEYITSQLKKLQAMAKKHGYAIGIGHPYRATLNTLTKELPKLKNKFEIVRANQLTSVPG